MGYDPTQAGDPIPRKFKNVLKCIANEIITMEEAVLRGRKQKLYEGEGANDPYWDLCFETLDAKRPDGTALTIPTAVRLITREGADQDNTQRPHRLAIAFAGIGITLFPGDPEGKFDAWCTANRKNKEPFGVIPNYDASKVIGRVFLVEMEPMLDKQGERLGRDMPLPLTVEPESYIYTGKVREVKPREDSGAGQDGATAPSTFSLVDILADDGKEGLDSVLGIINGQPAEGDGLFDLLQASGLASTLTIGGESVIGAALNDVLASKLEEAGHVTIKDGKIAVA